MVTLPISFFTAARKGDVMARMSGDVGEIENSIMQSLDMMFKNPIAIIVYLSIMLMLSWKLTVFVLILLPLAGLVMGRVGKALKRQSLAQQNQWGVLMSNIEECLGGLRIIKAFNAEKKVEDRFHRENQEFYRLSNRIARRQALAHPMSEFLGTIAVAIVLWFGGTLILGGSSHIDAADFIFYMTIFYSLINPAKDLSKAMYSIQTGLAAMERVDKILGAENPIKDPLMPQEIKHLQGHIRYENITFAYGGPKLRALLCWDKPGGGHAVEMETSMAMAAIPGTVKMEQQCFAEPVEPKDDLAHLKEKRIHTALWWYGMYPENVTGSPGAATPEKGEAALAAAAEDLTEVIRTIKADTAAPRLQKEFYERLHNIRKP